MNKKLLTLAVAAALAAPAIASAEAIMYGKINVSLDYIDVEQNATFFRPGNPNTSPRFDFTLANTGSVAGTPSTFQYVQYTGRQTAVVTTGANAAYNSAADQALATGKTPAQAQVLGQQAQAAYLANPDNQGSAYVTAANATGPQAGFTRIDEIYNAELANNNRALALNQISEAQYDRNIAVLGLFQHVGTQSAANAALVRGQKFKGWGMDQGAQGPADRLGVKGSEDLGNGLKAVYQIELGVDITNSYRDNNIINGNRGTTTTNSGFAFRNTYIGLAGDWGTVLMGRHDTPLKISTGRLDLFSDTLADYNNTIGFQDLRVDNTVAYVSPSWSGFQLMAAIVPQGGATSIGVFNTEEDSLAGIYSLAAIYKNGPFYGSVAYEALDEENWTSQNNNYALLYDGKTAESDSKWRVGLGLLDWNGFTLTGIYEDRQHILGAPEDADGNFFQVQAAYAFGNNTIKGMWGRADLNRCADPNGVGFRYTCPSSDLGRYFSDTILVQNNEKTGWAIGYDYNFSKRTLAYALFTQVDDTNEDANWSGFSLGMMHSF